MQKDGREITLGELAQSCGVTEGDLTLDKLDVHVGYIVPAALSDMERLLQVLTRGPLLLCAPCPQIHNFNKAFRRFDLFNRGFNPLGAREFRKVFLKIDNYINGRYLAELTHDWLAHMTPNVACEPRLSIYGKSARAPGSPSSLLPRPLHSSGPCAPSHRVARR